MYTTARNPAPTDAAANKRKIRKACEDGERSFAAFGNRKNEERTGKNAAAAGWASKRPNEGWSVGHRRHYLATGQTVNDYLLAADDLLFWCVGVDVYSLMSEHGSHHKPLPTIEFRFGDEGVGVSKFVPTFLPFSGVMQ